MESDKSKENKTYQSENSTQIAQLWNKIEQWLEINAPEIKETLNSPATLTEIENLENKISVKLPEDIKQSLMIHNGQTCGVGKTGLIGSWELLSVKRIYDEWKVWKELYDGGDFKDDISEPANQGIKNDWWNPRWIPLTYSGCGDHHCFDADPTDKGFYGQIILMYHDYESRPFVAKSYSEWLNNIAESLDNETFTYDSDEGWFDCDGFRY